MPKLSETAQCLRNSIKGSNNQKYEKLLNRLPTFNLPNCKKKFPFFDDFNLFHLVSQCIKGLQTNHSSNKADKEVSLS